MSGVHESQSATAKTLETPGTEAHNSTERLDTDLDRSERLRDQIQGVTTEHASPPRLEDEGQSGG